MRIFRAKDTDRDGSAASRRPGAAGAGVLFSFTIILLVVLGYRIQSREFYSGILITEFVLILLPALLFVLFSGLDPKGSIRLKAPKAVNFPLIFVIMLFAVPLASVFNLFNLVLVNSIFGKIVVEPMPVAANGMELLFNIAVIAGSAGLCEEFLFRGVIQRAFERFGEIKAIALAAALFSFTHLDFQKIFGTFMLGALIGYIVYRTDSLYCGMFAHFTNNAAAVFAGYISNKLLTMLGTEEPISDVTDLSGVFDAFAQLAPRQLIFVFLFYGFIIIFIAIVFILLLYLLKRINQLPAETKPLLHAAADKGSHTALKRKTLLLLLPGLLAVCMWFYAEASGFMGVQNAVTEVFRHIIGVGA